MLPLIFLAITVASSIFLSSIVFLSARKNLNTYLGLLTLFIGLWAFGDLLMLYSHNESIIKVGVLLFAVAPMVTTFFVLLLSYALPEGKKFPKVGWAIICLPALILAGKILIDIDWLLNSIEIDGFMTRNNIIFEKSSFGLYSFYFTAYFLASFFFLVRRFMSASGVIKKQMKLVLIGITISSTAAVITNTTLPQYFDIYHLVWMGPIFTLFFSYMVSSAIVKHGFLDIRFLAAKTLAYAFLTLALSLIYSFIVFSTTNLFFSDVQTDSEVHVIYVLAALVLAFSFQPLKSFFDRFTNKIFYQDIYDTQELIDKLNDILVSSLDMQKLIHEVEKLISEQLKTSFLEIELYPIKAFRPETEHQNVLKKFLSENSDKVTDLDTDAEVKKALLNKSAAVISKLTDQEGRVLGLMLFGYKKSGSSYSQRDKKVIDIISDEIAIALQNSLRYEEIKQFSETLEKQVERATQELREKNQKLKELDQAKDDFISMASHQLRTPLTTIKGYLSMLQEGDFGILHDKQQQIIDLTYTSSERMVYLIADLLNVSRIATGRFVIEKTEIDLAAIIRAEMRQLSLAAKAKDLKLKLHIDEKLPIVRLDETKTRQVIMNLVDNAIYYTPAGGKVDVYLELDKDSFVFKVVDTGIGVPETDQASLFTKFFRAANAKNARPDGTGLGLYMAQKVIKDQGGAMIFFSKEGKGSTFGFRFSLAAAGAAKKPKK